MILKNYHLIIGVLILLSQSIFSQIITVGSRGDYTTLSAAATVAKPGDTLLLQAETHPQGTQNLHSIKGTANKPIVILAEKVHQSIFSGGRAAIHLIKCHYIELNGLVFEKQGIMGVNIDDGGDYDIPSTNITIRNCIFKDLDATGNNDLLKMSGIDNFLIEKSQFINGSPGGSAIDFVGCHNGIIQDCYFDKGGSTGIQNKGGTSHIRIQRNTFTNIYERALNLGGSTGLQFFRPPLGNPITDASEASDLEVFSNIFIGNKAPIAYVGCVRVNVSNNTFYKPDHWAIRILQENTTDGFLPCGDNTFGNNIVYVDNGLSRDINIGPNTDAGSFVFTNNLWYNEDDPNWYPNHLPVTDPNEINEDPIFIDAANANFKLDISSPAIQSGNSFLGVSTDFDKQTYKTPPTVGAYEYTQSLTIPQNKLESVSIDIYPNPTSNFLNVFTELNIEKLSVLDLNGKVLLIRENNTKINIQNLSNGIYLLKIYIKGGTVTNKLVIKKSI